ncbi:MAG: hypothetical protein AAFX93_03235 [Verrucomicrobiota bacterium]
MKKLHTTAILLVAAITLLTGCKTRDAAPATAGRMFNFREISTLSLGNTTPAQARAMFGEPKAEKTISNEFNEFTLLQYIFVKIDRYSGHEDYRVLTLEFVDDTLNGYLYGSSYPNDLGVRNLAASKSINRQVSTMADVTSMVGAPDGKAYYTTTLEAFKEGDGEEIWIWDQETQLVDEGIVQEKTLIGFDRTGTVDNVTTSKTKIN